MTSSNVIYWTPGDSPSLAIKAYDGERVDEEMWKIEVGNILEDLAKKEENPVEVLEDEWAMQGGDPLLELERVDELPEQAAFQNALERHEMTLPATAKKTLRKKDLPQNLRTWVQQLLVPIRD